MLEIDHLLSPNEASSNGIGLQLRVVRKGVTQEYLNKQAIAKSIDCFSKINAKAPSLKTKNIHN